MTPVPAGTDRVADRVYTVLVNEAGATNSESDRLQFRNFWKRDVDEYRFIGLLGFGGKLWKGRTEWHVSCYPEDETPVRREIIYHTNAALLALRDELAAVSSSPATTETSGP